MPKKPFSKIFIVFIILFLQFLTTIYIFRYMPLAGWIAGLAFIFFDFRYLDNILKSFRNDDDSDNAYYDDKA